MRFVTEKQSIHSSDAYLYHDWNLSLRFEIEKNELHTWFYFLSFLKSDERRKKSYGKIIANNVYF
jgi:hypothetical protein